MYLIAAVAKSKGPVSVGPSVWSPPCDCWMLARLEDGFLQDNSEFGRASCRETGHCGLCVELLYSRQTTTNLWYAVPVTMHLKQLTVKSHGHSKSTFWRFLSGELAFGCVHLIVSYSFFPSFYCIVFTFTYTRTHCLYHFPLVSCSCGSWLEGPSGVTCSCMHLQRALWTPYLKDCFEDKVL
jgi:hypothetical protein